MIQLQHWPIARALMSYFFSIIPKHPVGSCTCPDLQLHQLCICGMLNIQSQGQHKNLHHQLQNNLGQQYHPNHPMLPIYLFLCTEAAVKIYSCYIHVNKAVFYGSDYAFQCIFQTINGFLQQFKQKFSVLQVGPLYMFLTYKH